MTKKEFNYIKNKDIIINNIKLNFCSYNKNNKSYSSNIYAVSNSLQWEFLKDAIKLKYLWYFRPKGIYTNQPYYITRIIQRKHIKSINYRIL